MRLHGRLTGASKNAWSNASRKQIVNVTSTGHGLVLEFLFFGEVTPFPSVTARFGMDSNNTNVRIPYSNSTGSFLHDRQGLVLTLFS